MIARVFSGETPKLKSLFWKSLKKFSHVSTLLPGLLAIVGFFFSCFYDCLLIFIWICGELLIQLLINSDWFRPVIAIRFPISGLKGQWSFSGVLKELGSVLKLMICKAVCRLTHW